MLKYCVFAILLALFAEGLIWKNGFAQVPVVEVTADDSTRADSTDETITAKKKKKKKGKAFEDVIEDYEIIDGLFTFYRNQDENKIYMEIKPEQFNKIYLCNVTRESGDGALFDGGAMLFEFPFFLTRRGKEVQFIEKNLKFRADKSAAISRAVERDIPNSIWGRAKIESEPHPDRGSVLIEAENMFLQDIASVGQLTGRIKMSYSLDKKNSYFSMLKSFPENTEVEVTLHFNSSKSQPIYTLADSRSMFHRYRYSLSNVPESDYKPRKADDRVGHFVNIHQDYTSVLRDDPYERYITRWNLQKAEPKFSLSKPKQPVVYWLENTIPVEYRDAIREGVLMWNSAFEKIGIKDALEVRQMPDDADWDPADIRYNTIRWIVQPGAAYAAGPSRINPYTGEIYDADIRFSADFVRFLYSEFEEIAQPAAWTRANINMFFPGAAIDEYPNFHGMEAMTGIAGEDRGSPEDLQMRYNSELPNGAGISADNMFRHCRYADGMQHQMAFAWSLLSARAAANGGSVDLEKYIHDALVSVSAHEVGHTLGLRHNFKASSIHALEKLTDKSYAREKGLTGSVMDYTGLNVSPKGQKQGAYYQTTLGPYDYWAIEYAYAPYDENSKDSETAMLEKIASRVSEADLAYGTDEDAFGFSARSVDPTCNLWDLGSDPLAFYRSRIQLTGELWDSIEKDFARKGQTYNKLRMAFNQGLREYALGGMTTSKYIGGLYHYRDHIGDPKGRSPFAVVPAEKQREALQFLIDTYFLPNSFQFSPELLNKLAPDRNWDFQNSAWRMARLDYPIHGIVQVLQATVLLRIYSPMVLVRMQDNEIRFSNGRPFTLAELFAELREAIWQEAPAGSNVNSFRRELQRMHLYALDRIIVKSKIFYPHDAVTMARADLVKIKAEIDKSLRNSQLDAYTEAHFQESAAKIDAVLNAQMERKY